MTKPRRTSLIRNAAKLAGKSTYFTGTPCKQGHTSDRRTITGQCLVCEKSTKRRYYASPKGAALRKKHDTSFRRKESRHGLPRGWYNKQIIKQKGLCALCSEQLVFDRTVHIDHDHRCCSKRRGCLLCVRGLLCKKCNTGLGIFGDSPERLRAAAEYIESFAADARVLQHLKET